jgi:ketosteroid isomerase-like protein
MGLTKDDVRKLIAVYMKAWREQDPDLIVTIFDQDATYHERVMEDITIAGRDAIRDYWKSKVVGAQANIVCGLVHTYLDHDTGTAICEWVAEFDDVAQGVRKRMKEIAVLEFRDGLISSLREYWASTVAPALEAAER